MNAAPNTGAVTPADLVALDVRLALLELRAREARQPLALELYRCRYRLAGQSEAGALSPSPEVAP